MFFDNNDTWIEKGAKTVELKCDNCGNTADNFVLGGYSTPHVGFVFLPKKMQLGKKAYVLCCPVCNNVNKELSFEELQTLKNK